MEKSQSVETQKNDRIGIPALKRILNNESIQKKFSDMLGKKSAGFITSVINVCQNNSMLANADANSIVLAAASAAALDLPVNPNLGYAAIIPYYDGKNKVTVAQFQLQRNAWVELAMRTGQVVRIANEPVYKGELVSKNRFTDEYVFDESKRESDEIIGYMAYAKLVNGYEKTVYWTVQECKEHGKRYSQTFKNGKGLWVDNFSAMALKGLALDTIIPTPNGYTTMGKIQVGDELFNALGETTKVIAKSDVKNLPCYEIELETGDVFVCDEEHRWFVKGTKLQNNKDEWRVMETKDMFAAHSLGYKIVLPNKPTTEMPKQDYWLDPYCLGYWLGNGSHNAATVCCCEDDLDEIKEHYDSYYRTSTRHDERSKGVVINIASKTGDRDDMSSMKQQLKHVGVYKNKHIPLIYKRGSVEQRRELVRGLCDSDGSIDIQRGRVSYTSTKENLADDLKEVLSSLGERPFKMENEARGYGVTTTVYTIMWQPITFNPFHLKRKSERVVERKFVKQIEVRSIKKIESVPTQCIAVDCGNATDERSMRKSFLVGYGYVPTHNTVLKHLIVKYLPKSIELNTAIERDQAELKGDIDNIEASYIDNVKEDEPFVDFEEVEQNKK